MSELFHEAFVLTTDPIAADPPARPSPTLVVSTAYGVTFSEPLITNCLASRLLFRATGWTREGEAAVFRLTATNGEDGQGPVLKVEGRLVGAWVDELERAVATATESSQPLTLDLNGLSFVDTHGVELLRRAARQGARLVGGSAFVTTLIPQED